MFEPFPAFFKTKHWKQDPNPQFLNKTETKIRKMQSPGQYIHFKQIKPEDMSMIKLYVYDL